MLVLFRRRQVWLPTAWGWLLLMSLAVLGVIGLARAANGYLAPEQPARGGDGRGARTLAVEGWLDGGDLDQAVAAFRRGRYERVLATGGPIEKRYDPEGFKTYAARAAAYLRSHGLADAEVIALPAPETLHDRTYLNGLMVRQWAQRSGISLGALDVFSAGVHARRSGLVYQMALGDGVEVGMLASTPQDYDAQHWWRSSSGTKATMSETLSLLWTRCCFWPPAPTDAYE